MPTETLWGAFGNAHKKSGMTESGGISLYFKLILSFDPFLYINSYFFVTFYTNIGLP